MPALTQLAAQPASLTLGTVELVEQTLDFTLFGAHTSPPNTPGVTVMASPCMNEP